MAEILGNPVSVSKISNGFRVYNQTYGRKVCRNCCQCFLNNSATKTCRRCVGRGRGVPMVSMPVNGYSSLAHVRTRNFVYIPKTIACAESILVCEHNDEQNINQRGQVEYNLDSLEKNLVADRSMDSEGIDWPSTSSNGKASVNDSRLYFLEERDEKVLSRRVLMLSRTNKVRSALDLFRSMEFTGLRPNVHACNSLVSCLLRNGLLSDALNTFEFMRENGIATGHTYSLVLKGVAKTRGCDSALDMFAELEENSRHRKDFDVIVYNTVISICGKTNNWVETERLWRKMKENGFVGTEITYSLLVSIFSRCDQNDLALDAYYEMVQNGLEPREDIMHALITVSTKEGKLDLALSVFQNMLNSERRPSHVVCNALINSLGKSGEAKLAFKIYKIMKSLGYKPDSFTWNALLGALYAADQPADAFVLFEKIRSQKTPLDMHLYNSALMSCKKLGWWEKALQLIWQMEESGLSVPAASYNLAIGACEVARKPEVALQVYEHMVHQNCDPDIFTLLSLTRSCIWGSLWDEVEAILKVAPDVSLYNTAIQGMFLKGKIEAAKKLYGRMLTIDLEPDGKTRALMLQYLRDRPRFRKRLRF